MIAKKLIQRPLYLIGDTYHGLWYAHRQHFARRDFVPIDGNMHPEEIVKHVHRATETSKDRQQLIAAMSVSAINQFEFSSAKDFRTRMHITDKFGNLYKITAKQASAFWKTHNAGASVVEALLYHKIWRSRT